MFLVLIFGLLVGNTVQYQFKYDHCKEAKFKGEYCSTPKKLNKLSDFGK
jgi:hypothetical protein